MTATEVAPAVPPVLLVLAAVSSVQFGAALAGFLVLDEGLAAREIVAILLVVAASAGAARRAGVAPRDA